MLGKCGVTKVMVVTGSHVVKSLGPKLFAALEDAGMPYEVFSEVEANPSVNTVEKIRTQYTDTGCSGFVALGGGSPMDATKGVAARAAGRSPPSSPTAKRTTSTRSWISSSCRCMPSLTRS